MFPEVCAFCVDNDYDHCMYSVFTSDDYDNENQIDDEDNY